MRKDLDHRLFHQVKQDIALAELEQQQEQLKADRVQQEIAAVGRAVREEERRKEELQVVVEDLQE